MPVFSSDYKIFVDTCGLPTGITSIIRLLKSHSATLVHHIQEADIVLVNPEDEESGQRLIRDWALDPTKRVLDFRWARRSVDEGRALKEADNWGGYLLDPSMGAREVDDDDVVLPPSVPVKWLTTQHTQPPNGAQPTQLPNHTASGMAGYSHPTNGVYGAGAAQQASNFASTSNIAGPSNQPPPVTYEQYTPTNPQFMNQPAATQMYPDSALQPSMYSSYAQPQNYGTQQFPSASMHQPTYTEQPQSQYAYPLPAMPNLPANVPDDQRFQLISMLQNYVNTLQQQPSTSQLPPMPTPPPAASQRMQSSAPQPSTPVESSRRRKRSTHSPAPNSSSPTSSFPSQDHSSWATVYPAPKPKNKGKGKVKAEPTSPTTGIMNHQRAKRSKPIGSPVVSQFTEGSSSSARQDLRIFERSQDHPIPFFIPLAVRNRRDLVLKITRNGGRVVTDIPDADYAIFDSISGQKKDIVVLLNHCLQLAKPTVLSADFIRDSVDQYKFLDPNVYLLDKTSKRRRSVQVKAEPESSSEGSAVEEAGVELVKQEVRPPKKRVKSESLKESPKPSPTLKKARNSHTNGASPSSASVSNTTPKKRRASPSPSPSPTPDVLPRIGRSPTPPPAHTAQKTGGGKYRYTEAELRWAGEHIKYLVANDPDISSTEMGKSLGAKVPHHTPLSWSVYITKAVPNVEELRKRAHIARRKREHAAKTEESVANVRRTEEDDAQEDFKFICQFFAYGGGDNGDDNEVWARIEEQGVCKTAAKWTDFYETRPNEIQAEIKRIFDGRADKSLKREAD